MLAGATFTWCFTVLLALCGYMLDAEWPTDAINALFVMGWWTIIVPAIGAAIACLVWMNKRSWRNEVVAGKMTSALRLAVLGSYLRNAVDRYLQEMSFMPGSTLDALIQLAPARLKNTSTAEWLWSRLVALVVLAMHLPIVGFLLARWFIHRNARSVALVYASATEKWEREHKSPPTNSGGSGGGGPKPPTPQPTVPPPPKPVVPAPVPPPKAVPPPKPPMPPASPVPPPPGHGSSPQDPPRPRIAPPAPPPRRSPPTPVVVEPEGTSVVTPTGTPPRKAAGAGFEPLEEDFFKKGEDSSRKGALR
jgi:hypothetical protein